MDKIELSFLDENLAYELMSVPTYSGMEERMITFIVLWAKKNNITCQLDDLKNVYLTKGSINENEFYPCVTSHMDTVQTKHKEYIETGSLLDVKTRINKDNKHEIYVDGMGIGGDDKCGILVSLSLFKYFDNLKAAFFVSEETGCVGSGNMDKSFFDNVGYVIGWDSPDVNRNAWSCSGQKLFSYDFYVNHMKKVCDDNGRTIFYSEPFTDVAQIREKLDITCMNFGSGGYGAHSATEYAILEDIDVSVKFGKELIAELGNKRYNLEKDQRTYSSMNYTNYLKDENGVYLKDKDGHFIKEEKNSICDDTDKLRSLGDNNRYGKYTYYDRNHKYDNYGYDDDDDDDYYGYYNMHKNKHNKQEESSLIKDEDALKFVMDKYDERIMQIHEDVENHIFTIEENIKAKCDFLGINYEEEFKDLIDNDVNYIFEEEILF